MNNINDNIRDTTTNSLACRSYPGMLDSLYLLSKIICLLFQVQVETGDTIILLTVNSFH